MIASLPWPPDHAAGRTAAVPGRRAPSRRILVFDADASSVALMREWLVPEGWRVRAVARDEARAQPAPALAVVDLAFPRAGACSALALLREALAGTPILVVSATIFAGVGCSGSCAARLGVAGVMAKPLVREPFVREVSRLARGSMPLPAAS